MLIAFLRCHVQCGFFGENRCLHTQPEVFEMFILLKLQEFLGSNPDRITIHVGFMFTTLFNWQSDCYLIEYLKLVDLSSFKVVRFIPEFKLIRFPILSVQHKEYVSICPSPSHIPSVHVHLIRNS